MGRVHFPLLGAAYYPEAWPEEEIDKDIAIMQEAGITVVRIGEFAWKKMEPQEGMFCFEWLHSVIDKLENAGISVILGTPSATPPMWLEELDPQMWMIKENGMPMQHGGRRHCCSNNPTFQKYSVRIAKKMVQEFGRHKNVIGWQIDNEIASFDGCWCEYCRSGFAEHLRKRYGSIEKMNQRWNLNLFSQAYDSFEEVPRPLPHTWHSPHLKYEWNQFLAQSHIRFVKMQADVLHQHTSAPIGTDMMPVFNEDFEKMNAFLDVVQYNHYDDEKSISREVFWLDYMRGLKDRPFWVTETATCWNGATSTPSTIRKEGFCSANSWLPIVLGAEANMYWLWRQHWAGHELMHGAVLYASGRPMHIWNEVRRLAEDFQECSDFLSSTKVVTQTAVMVSTNCDYLMKEQEVVWEEGSNPWETAYTKRLLKAYNPLISLGIRPDVIPAGKRLDAYRLIYTPFMLSMEEGDLPERIQRWVRNGGVWVVGPMTDIRNDIGAHYLDRETGFLESFTNTTMVYQIPDAEHRTKCCWKDGTEFLAEKWLQLFEISDDTEQLVTVSNGYSSLVGKVLAFRKQIGKGWVYVLGTLPSEKDGERILTMAAEQAEIRRIPVNGKIAASERQGNGYQGIAATEYGGDAGQIILNGVYTDLLTGERLSQKADMSAYQTRILVREK